MISCATREASLMGIEKPTPIFPDWVEEDDESAEAMATLTPMTWPFVLTRAPPELPGLMAASVWMTLVLIERCVAVAKRLCVLGAADEAVSIARLAADTMPSVTVPL